VFQFSNRQAIVFGVVMLVAGALTIWLMNHIVYDWWFPTQIAPPNK
jgi:hypothetical protein